MLNFFKTISADIEMELIGALYPETWIRMSKIYAKILQKCIFFPKAMLVEFYNNIY